MLISAIKEEEVSGAKAHELTDDDVLKVIAREIKKRRESVEVYTKAGRDELAASEQAEIDVLSAYQPKQLDDSEVEELVDGVIEKFKADGGELSMKSMGQIMKEATAKAGGTVDGKRLSSAVRAKLS